MGTKRFILVVFALCLFLQGCETAKGFKHVGKGFVKDVENLPGGVKRTDEWIRENLW